MNNKPTVTFLFAAHDQEHNNAVALKEYLENHARFFRQDKVRN
jgi:uncharacterized protein YeaO (DUF488 family)